MISSNNCKGPPQAQGNAPCAIKLIDGDDLPAQLPAIKDVSTITLCHLYEYQGAKHVQLLSDLMCAAYISKDGRKDKERADFTVEIHSVSKIVYIMALVLT